MTPKVKVWISYLFLLFFQILKIHHSSYKLYLLSHVTMAFYGHLRSKIMVPNESPIMTSYDLKLIVTMCPFSIILKISVL